MHGQRRPRLPLPLHAPQLGHYDAQFGLALSAQEKADLVEYLKSI
jgi:hypothetical protein